MKTFIKYLIKPLAIVSCVPSLGLLSYYTTENKTLLITSLLIYFGVILGFAFKYFLTPKSNSIKN